VTAQDVLNWIAGRLSDKKRGREAAAEEDGENTRAPERSRGSSTSFSAAATPMSATGGGASSADVAMMWTNMVKEGTVTFAQARPIIMAAFAHATTETAAGTRDPARVSAAPPPRCRRRRCRPCSCHGRLSGER